VDILEGGSPCQAFSIAGIRLRMRPRVQRRGHRLCGCRRCLCRWLGPLRR
jgi:site-specific DNA-cytosine methylase